MLTSFSAIDRRLMRRALVLAKRGRGRTLPNPQVGAVVASPDGKILGEGYHARAGEPHAEVNAIRHALERGHDVRGATLYVTLEPCTTHGRTPPCSDLVSERHLGRVVYAATDPNPNHVGAARKILEEKGIQVDSGLFAEEATHLNRDFNHWIVHRRPWVVGKIALSLEGSITTATGDDRWLTSPEARELAHELRWDSDAILIGAETARQDNPRLTIRLADGRNKPQPWRVVVTRSGNLPPTLSLFTDVHRDRTQVYQNRALEEVVSDLGRQGVAHLLLEGGAQVLTEALNRGLVNEVAFFMAPIMTGTGNRALHLLKKTLKLKKIQYVMVGPDLFARGEVPSTLDSQLLSGRGRSV